MKNLARALHFFRPDKLRLLTLFGLLVASLLLSVLKPWPLAVIVDSVLGEKPAPSWLEPALAPRTDSGQILLLVGALLVLFGGQALLASVSNYVAIGIGLRGLTRVRQDVFGCLQRLSLRFHHGTRSGDLIYRAATDTYAFQTLFQHGLVTFVSSVLALVFILVVMWQVNRPLTFLALGVIPLLILTIKFFGTRMRRLGLRAQEAESSVTSLIQQGIHALPLVQSYTREEDEQRRFTVHADQARENKLSQHGSEIVYGLMISVGLALGTAGITWLGASQVLSGQLTIGQLLVFLAYLNQMFDPLNQLSYVGSTIAGALAGVDRVVEILDSPEEVHDRPDARPVSTPGSPHTLTLQEVTFAYTKDQPVLKNISFEFQTGTATAIIGPSGAGKTTLLNLLPRFFDPVSGRILLDGADLRDLKVKDLRGEIGLVLQEPIILPGTLAENIAYGKPDASLDDIRAAAEAANAHHFINRLPKQYNTLVGDGGAGLSVGERQRINLARAFLKNAPILLLDEPTSSLDAESESLIVESLGRLMKNRTTIIVAHRLSTIAHVDAILTIENGLLTQSGPPAQLKDQPGYYSQILIHHAAG